jgi:hypothetical protein
MALLDRLKRKRRCACHLETAWLHRSLEVTPVGPLGTLRLASWQSLPLAVEVSDVHVLEVTCRCDHSCEGDDREEDTGPCSTKVAVESPVTVRWDLEGGGALVDAFGGSRHATAEGHQVLWHPPPVPVGERRTSKLRATASHAAGSAIPPDHGPYAVELTVTVARLSTEELEVTVTGPPPRPRHAAEEERTDAAEPCGCTPSSERKAGKVTADLSLVPKGVVAVGDRVRLAATVAAQDSLVLACAPTGHCAPTDMTVNVPAAPIVRWECSAGDLPAGELGSSVVWEAPSTPGRATVRASVAREGAEPLVLSADIDVVGLTLEVDDIPAEWMPDARAGLLSIGARIAPPRPRTIAVRLEDVSREPGVCCNYPLQAATQPDLFLSAEHNPGLVLGEDGTAAGQPPCPTEILEVGDNPPHTAHHLSATTADAVTEVTTVVRCEDFGATGSLVVGADGCAPVRRAINPLTDPDADLDGSPGGDGTAGDGLTAYEEHRGFIVGGGSQPKEHVRTDPAVKDVFVHDRDNVGTGHFGQSGLAVHVLRDPVLYGGDDRRVVNFNSAAHKRGDQHGILLVREDLGGAVRGIAFGGPGRPGQIDRVAVDASAVARENIPGLPDKVRAHVLGHAVGIAHHGEGRKHDGCGPGTERDGGPSSGDAACVMRYSDYAEGWCHAEPHHRHGATAAQEPATAYCSSPKGTGVNADGGHTNDAARGDCLGQIRVRDWD